MLLDNLVTETIGGRREERWADNMREIPSRRYDERSKRKSFDLPATSKSLRHVIPQYEPEHRDIRKESSYNKEISDVLTTQAEKEHSMI